MVRIRTCIIPGLILTGDICHMSSNPSNKFIGKQNESGLGCCYVKVKTILGTDRTEVVRVTLKVELATPAMQESVHMNGWWPCYCNEHQSSMLSHVIVSVIYLSRKPDSQDHRMKRDPILPGFKLCTCGRTTVVWTSQCPRRNYWQLRHDLGVTTVREATVLFSLCNSFLPPDMNSLKIKKADWQCATISICFCVSTIL